MCKDTIYRQLAIDVVTGWLNIARHPSNRSKYNEGEINAYKTVLSELIKIPSAQLESHYCRDCKWSRCCIYNIDKHGKNETYWHCLNWDVETDEEGYCHEWAERR